MWKPLDLKSFAVIAAASILLTGANIWMHRNEPPVGWVTMHDFGLKFTYPKNIPLGINTPNGWNQNYWEGAVQGEDAAGGFELVGLFWTTGEAGSKAETLVSLLESARDQDGIALEWGESKTKSVSGYDVNYLEILISIEDLKVPGVIAGFHDPYGRLMMPYHLGYPGSIGDSMGMVDKMIRIIEFDEPKEPFVMEAYWPTEGWRYALPSQMGMDGEKLQRMVDAIEGSSYSVDSAMVIKDGYVVLDEYFGDFSKDDLHIIYSCTRVLYPQFLG